MSELNDLTKFVDTTVRAQDDFYAFVNGKWLQTTEIPEDKARWGSFIILDEKSVHDVKSLLESGEFTDSDFKKIVKFYTEGMNVQKRNELDYTPLKPYLDSINAIQTKDDLINVLVLYSILNSGIRLIFRLLRN